jgi:flagellar hook-length control protein FliK
VQINVNTQRGSQSGLFPYNQAEVQTNVNPTRLGLKGSPPEELNLLAQLPQQIKGNSGAGQINVNNIVLNKILQILEPEATAQPQAKQAVTAETNDGLPINKQTLNVSTANQQTNPASTQVNNALQGKAVQDTGGNSPQVDNTQVVLNAAMSTNASTVKTAGVEAPTFARPGDNALFMQLAEAVRGHVHKDGQGQTQVRLQLHPANLGEVSIKLTYRDGHITTHFHAATEQARQVIESSLPQLRETLAGYQLNLQSATVSAGDEGNRWGQRENQGRQFNKQRGSHLTERGKTTETISGTGPEAAATSSANQLNYFA